SKKDSKMSTKKTNNKVSAAQQTTDAKVSDAQQTTDAKVSAAAQQAVQEPDKYSGSWSVMPKKYVRLIAKDVLRGVPYRDAVRAYVADHKKWIQPDQS